jgi:hypothetical protein
MTNRITACLLALGLATASSVALAEGPAAPASGAGPAAGPMGKGPMAGERKGGHKGQMMRREKPESFTEQSVRTMADGRVFKRSVEQKVGEGSFSRKEVLTNPDGKSATRTMSATLSKDGKTWTRKVEGVEFDGTTWQRSREVPALHGPDGDDDMGAAAPQPGKPAPRPRADARKAN